MLKNLVQKIKSHKKIGVFSHIRPDGDAIGSQIAFCLWAVKNNINVYAFNVDEPPSNIHWLSDYFEILRPTVALADECEAFVFMDGNNVNRFGDVGHEVLQSEKPAYLIDHHPDPDDIFTETYSVDTASSTAELVYDLYEATDLNLLDEHAAKAIYTGLATDTGSFRFDTVTPRIHLIVAELLKRGKFKPNEVHEAVFDTRTPNQLHLLGKALETIELHADNQIGSITVTEKMLHETGCSYADTEGFVSYPLSIDGVKAAVLFCELEGKVKLSLRSKSDILVNVWARIFNGGGHKRAAGAWHQGPLKLAKKEVIEAGMEQLTAIKS